MAAQQQASALRSARHSGGTAHIGRSTSRGQRRTRWPAPQRAALRGSGAPSPFTRGAGQARPARAACQTRQQSPAGWGQPAADGVCVGGALTGKKTWPRGGGPVRRARPRAGGVRPMPNACHPAAHCQEAHLVKGLSVLSVLEHKRLELQTKGAAGEQCVRLHALSRQFARGAAGEGPRGGRRELLRSSKRCARAAVALRSGQHRLAPGRRAAHLLVPQQRPGGGRKRRRGEQAGRVSVVASDSARALPPTRAATAISLAFAGAAVRAHGSVRRPAWGRRAHMSVGSIISSPSGDSYCMGPSHFFLRLRRAVRGASVGVAGGAGGRRPGEHPQTSRATSEPRRGKGRARPQRRLPAAQQPPKLPPAPSYHPSPTTRRPPLVLSQLLEVQVAPGGRRARPRAPEARAVCRRAGGRRGRGDLRAAPRRRRTAACLRGARRCWAYSRRASVCTASPRPHRCGSAPGCARRSARPSPCRGRRGARRRGRVSGERSRMCIPAHTRGARGGQAPGAHAWNAGRAGAGATRPFAARSARPGKVCRMPPASLRLPPPRRTGR